MVRTIFFLMLLVLVSPLWAEKLIVGNTYRLGITVTVSEAAVEKSPQYTALKNSKFIVISETSGGKYVVRFDERHISSDLRYEKVTYVLYDKAYILEPTINGTIPIESISKASNSGLSAGPLVVPFKYRLNEKSISGDATLGFYAGATFEPGCVTENWCFRLTPLISAGLSQVSVAKLDGSGTENKTSVTWATGLLITDWANMNIGLIYGQDRIGDKTWENEGKGWLSFMIGWQL